MTKFFSYTGLISLLIFAGCSTTMNVNTSSLGNAANTVGNTANRVANTISNAASSVTATSDNDFMKEAAIGGMSEVELGRLASTKATDPEIKKFGQMMVTDHSKAGAELKALAAKKNVQLPAELDSTHKSMLDNLKNKSGADFDKEYVSEMVDDHETDLKAFQEKARNATDPDVKAFAEKVVPVIQKHLDAIKAIQAKMNK
jgi:putative membrane protein